MVDGMLFSDDEILEPDLLVWIHPTAVLMAETMRDLRDDGTFDAFEWGVEPRSHTAFDVLRHVDGDWRRVGSVVCHDFRSIGEGVRWSYSVGIPRVFPHVDTAQEAYDAVRRHALEE